MPGPVEELSKPVGRSQETLAPLSAQARSSDSLIANSLGTILVRKARHSIQRFIFMGPRGGGDTIRLAIFAGFYGDDVDGPRAIVQFLRDLENQSGVATGYHIYAYPICNPSGFDAGERCNAQGRDLTKQFWNGSNQIEAYYLEREMGVHRFHGVISISGTDAPALRVFVTGGPNSTLRGSLASPRLPASRILESESPSGKAANAGFLTRTDELRPMPFEIDMEIPRQDPPADRAGAATDALKSILESYRSMIAIRQYL